MKRTLFLLLVLSATGCIELPLRPEPTATFGKAPKAPEIKATVPEPVTEAPPVSPDQVNDASAPKVLDALRQEMDRAAALPAAPKP
jgi:hypothetical protein